MFDHCKYAPFLLRLFHAENIMEIYMAKQYYVLNRYSINVLVLKFFLHYIYGFMAVASG